MKTRTYPFKPCTWGKRGGGLEQENSIAVSSVTQKELIIGCRNKNELLYLEQFLDRFHIIRLWMDKFLTWQKLKSL